MVLRLKKTGVLLAAVVLVGASGLPARAREPLRDTTDRAFLRELVTSVNAYRARHGVPRVRLDAKVTRYAKSRARKVSSQEELKAGHSGLSHDYGENLFWHGASEPHRLKGSVAVKEWYDEGAAYDFDAGEFSRGTGHFTQLVWKGSTTIGAARVSGRGHRWHETYIVVDFRPRGNLTGAFKENVLPAK